MKSLLQPKRQFIIASATGATTIFAPTAFAKEATYSPKIIMMLISKLLTVFQSAGALLLAYAMIALILAMKNEDAESKVNAITQISIAIILITISGTVKTLMSAAGVTYTG